MIKRALINFAMIQTAIFATSVHIGVHIPTSNGVVMAVAFVWLVSFIVSLIPVVLVSSLFAYFQRA